MNVTCCGSSVILWIFKVPWWKIILTHIVKQKVVIIGHQASHSWRASEHQAGRWWRESGHEAGRRWRDSKCKAYC